MRSKGFNKSSRKRALVERAAAPSNAPAPAAAPSGRFPGHWGQPPLRQTRDLRDLPGGYGQGSGTLAKWIQDNLDKDQAATAPAPAESRFPGHWGQPPLRQTRDLRDLPGGYGQGSGTLAKWIQDNLDKDQAATAPAPAESRFPAHWGQPPLRQTRDLRDLPGAYGKGSGTLAKWIHDNLDKDQAAAPDQVLQTEVDALVQGTALVQDLSQASVCAIGTLDALSDRLDQYEKQVDSIVERAAGGNKSVGRLKSALS